MLTSLVFGAMTIVKKNQIEGCDGNHCPASSKSAHDTASTYATLSTISFVGGVLLGGVGFLLIPGSEEEKAAGVATPNVYVGPTGVHAKWKF